MKMAGKVSLTSSKLHTYIFEMFTYSTVRSASIQSTYVGIVYRIVQLILLVYIVGWELYRNKGYQSFDTVSSVVTTKVKGLGYVAINQTHDRASNRSNPDYYPDLFALKPEVQYKIYDTADYIIPPNEYNSIFIMTNFIETQQSQGFCDEEANKYKAQCETDADCMNLGLFMNSWNGAATGRCVKSSMSHNKKVCEVSAWCPTEHDNERTEDNIIRNTLNFTIFIKNEIEFKKFDKKQRNILPNITNKYISQCAYEDKRDTFCPVFPVEYIMNLAEPDPDERYQMLLKGGVILIEIIWNCDYDFSSSCLPKYHFTRFDYPFKETKTSSGFNFRFANKFRVNNRDYRMLYKAYGLRFIINVSGTAGKFNIIPLMLTIGAGIGLMSISVLVADCVMLHCTKDRKYFAKMKELDVDLGINLKADLLVPKDMEVHKNSIVSNQLHNSVARL